mmetsp:Transcript_31964/g.96236  ORF Transcript_31964/g.96236 Transcript_31964/m.96236 type:complete len:449 (-) Transcript_31964:152-1498(-)
MGLGCCQLKHRPDVLGCFGRELGKGVARPAEPCQDHVELGPVAVCNSFEQFGLNLVEQLGKDTAVGPHVDSLAPLNMDAHVTHDDFWGTIPLRNHHVDGGRRSFSVTVAVPRESSKSKVQHLDLQRWAQRYVLRLEIAMDDPGRVQVRDASQDGVCDKEAVFFSDFGPGSSPVLQPRSKIIACVLKHHINIKAAGGVGLEKAVEKLDNVVMLALPLRVKCWKLLGVRQAVHGPLHLQLGENLDLSVRHLGQDLVVVRVAVPVFLALYLLDRHHCASPAIPRCCHHTVRPARQAADLVVPRRQVEHHRTHASIPQCPVHVCWNSIARIHSALLRWPLHEVVMVAIVVIIIVIVVIVVVVVVVDVTVAVVHGSFGGPWRCNGSLRCARWGRFHRFNSHRGCRMTRVLLRVLRGARFGGRVPLHVHGLPVRAAYPFPVDSISSMLTLPYLR